MAWPNPFRQPGPNTRTCWGYTFDLTKEHLSEEELEPLKHSYDTLAEECLDILDTITPANPRNTIGRSKSDDSQTSKCPFPLDRDTYTLLEQHHSEHAKLQEMWTQINTVPDWVDWNQIARGQDVFYRYGGACVTGLAYQSLLGGMGAARVVETLARTGGFSAKAARRRIMETTQHILECTLNLESMQPGGRGFASTVRVRFLHAAVRRRIMKLAAQRPKYFDLAGWGVPVNDLDSLATLGTFSATLIWVSLPRQGIYLRQQEIDDYLALWRYIGYVIGAPDMFMSTPSQAKAMMEVLLMYEINPSETSKIMANNIILSLADHPPANASADFLIAGARWLNGGALADRLGLSKPAPYYTLLMLGQCIFLSFWSYFYRTFPPLDRRHMASLRKIFWKVTVESDFGLGGNETGFEFKHVPEFDTLSEVMSTSETKPNMRGVEMRNLKSLVVAVGVLGVVGYSWWKVAVFGVGVVSGLAKAAFPAS